MKFQFNKALDKEISIFNLDGRQFSVPRRLNDRYKICDVLAAGGMGVIFVAEDSRLFDKKVLIKRCLYNPSLFQYRNDKNRKSAILTTRKTIDMEYASMMHGWARQIPNIPIPIDYFKDVNPEIYGPHKDINDQLFYGEKELYEEEPYLVINYFTGKPVKSDHPQVAKNVIGFAKFYIRNIANILKRFHTPYSSGDQTFEFFYCDLKPDNVILTDENQIVLIDMGSFAIRVNGQLAGEITTTPGYCAPELKNNQAMYLSPCVDVYTLAVSVFELITESPPKLNQYGNLIPNWSDFEDIVNKTNQNYLIDVFKKALDTDPQHRFQTMHEFTLALQQKKITGAYPNKPSNYIQKMHKKPMQITDKWHTSGSSQNLKKNIINYPVWRKEKFFDIQANATDLNSKAELDDIKKSLLMNLFNKSKDHLIKNFTFCPELLEATSQNVYLNHIPKFVDPEKKVIEWKIKSNLEKKIYLLMKLEQMKYRMIGISPDTIKYDTLFNPFVNEYWLLLDYRMYSFAENPCTQDIVGQNVILPPELKKDRIWIDEKSFSYLAGIDALFAIDPKKVLELYRQDKLYDKIQYEGFVRNLRISDQLKDTILSLINPLANMRLSPYEAISKLKNRSGHKVSRALKIKGIQIDYTPKFKPHSYILEYKKIGEITNKELFWRQLEKNKILEFKPTDNYKTILKKSSTTPNVLGKNIKAEEVIIKLLNEKIKKNQTDLAVLIVDDSIKGMKDQLAGVLEKFKQVILFSSQNPFKLSNIQYEVIENFLIAKGKKNKRKK